MAAPNASLPSSQSSNTVADSNMDSRKVSPDNGTTIEESYEDIMGLQGDKDGNEPIGGGPSALGDRLVAFREWLEKDAHVDVHPHICIVNGEATDGTKQAPVLLTAPPPGTASTVSAISAASGRCGMVDGEADRVLYDRTMGCQVRAAKEIKKDEIMMTVPRAAMVTPDLVAASDAGRAALACCELPTTEKPLHYWDAFENTTVNEKKFADRNVMSNGTQLLVKILQERKKAETAGAKSLREHQQGDSIPFHLCPRGTLSTRVPILLFLIHQRFANSASPAVTSESSAVKAELTDTSKWADPIILSSESPKSFGPYARTLPSSVALPLCWKRNELAVLAGCIPGIPPLQEVAAMTMQLASEFMALVDAGIMHRFPSIFPRGMITWERWVWAASVFMSRVLPVSCYLNKGEEKAENHVPSNPKEFQSVPEVWNELGVMIPLLDMLNHESEDAQLAWSPAVTDAMVSAAAKDKDVEMADANGAQAEKETEAHPPRAKSLSRVKKGNQIYCTYGAYTNQQLTTQYGFCQMNNLTDEVKVGWGLLDAIGDIPVPDDYKYMYKDDAPKASENEERDGEEGASPKANDPTANAVFDSTDSASVNRWWSKSRLFLLEREAMLDDSILSSLKDGKKMVTVAYSDGRYHPGLLSAAVVGTIPKMRVAQLAAVPKNENGQNVLGIPKSHQEILRKYLTFFFTRKLERLLQSLNNGLKDHYPSVQLWTKATEPGLQYNDENDDPDAQVYQGWQTFFDSHAYSTSIEIENRYYSMAPDSCVLTMYDGNLRALQSSIDGLATQERFESGVLRQLEELGFKLMSEEDEAKEAMLFSQFPAKLEENGSGQKAKDAGGKKDGKEKSKNARRRNRKKGGGGGERPPAIKLHIGNLSYNTSTTELFHHFAQIHGRDNVLECHIPVERETGRSRGFGFVTLPEEIATGVLQSGRKHEIDGRILKVAESNSAGSANRTGRASAGGPISSDRCGRCGYRPKYCVCAMPDLPPPGAFNGGRPYPDGPRNPDIPPGRDPEYDHYGASYRRERDSRGSYSRSPSRRDRDYDRDYRYRRGSRSRSYSRDRDGHRRRDDRERRRDHDRRDRGRSLSRSRSRDRSRDGRRRSSHSRGWDGRSSRSSRHSRSRSADSNRSYSGSRRRDRDRRTGETDAPDRTGDSRAKASSPPPQDRSSGTSERRRESSSRKRSRSRSRGRSGRRKRSTKKDGRKHARSRSPRSRSRSESPADSQERKEKG